MDNNNRPQTRAPLPGRGGRPENNEDDCEPKSKQKIMVLKQERQGSKQVYDSTTLTNRRAENVQLLQQSYDLCTIRANKVQIENESSLYFKVHEQKTARVYSALATLIYASISVAKADELEAYIRKVSAQLPTAVFDLEDWRGVIDVAKECRTQPSARRDALIDNFDKSVKMAKFMAANSVKTTQSEIRLLRNEVSSDMLAMQSDLANAKNLITFLMGKLTAMGSAGTGGGENISVGVDEGNSLTFSQHSSPAKSVHQHHLPAGSNSSPNKSMFNHNMDSAALEADLAHMRAQHETEIDALKAKHASERAAAKQREAELKQAANNDLRQMEAQYQAKVQAEIEAYRKLEDRLEEAEKLLHSGNSSKLVTSKSKEPSDRDNEEVLQKIRSLDEQVKSLEAKAMADAAIMREHQEERARLVAENKQHRESAEEANAKLAEMSGAASVVSQPAESTTTPCPPQPVQRSPSSVAASEEKVVKLEELLRKKDEELQELTNSFTAANTETNYHISAAEQKMTQLERELDEKDKEVQQLRVALAATTNTGNNITTAAASSEDTGSSNSSTDSMRGALAKQNELMSTLQQLSANADIAVKGLRESANAYTLQNGPDLGVSSNGPGSSLVLGGDEDNLDGEEGGVGGGPEKEKLRLQIALLKRHEVLLSEIMATTEEVGHVRGSLLKVLRDQQRMRGIEASNSEISLGGAGSLVTATTEFTTAAATGGEQQAKDIEQLMAELSQMTLMAEQNRVAVAQIEQQTSRQMLEYYELLDELALVSPSAAVSVAEAARVLGTTTAADEEEGGGVMINTPTKSRSGSNVSAPNSFAILDNSFVEPPMTPQTDFAAGQLRVDLENATQRCSELQTQLSKMSMENAVLVENLKFETNRSQVLLDENEMLKALAKQQQRTVVNGPPISSVSPRHLSSTSLTQAGSLGQLSLSRNTNPNDVKAAISPRGAGGAAGGGPVPRGVGMTPRAAALTREEANRAVEKIIQGARDRVSPTPHKPDEKPLVIPTDSEKHVVRIQSSMRAYLARQRVTKLRISAAATQQGVLLAYKGTKQGETGWYEANGLLFYFCVDKGEFVLLCGPITAEMFETAADELMLHFANESTSIAKDPSVGAVSHESSISSAAQLEKSQGGGGGGGGGEGLSSPGSGTLSLAKRQAAIRDVLPAKRSSNSAPFTKYPSTIIMDRLGVHATRVQIETLLDDLFERDNLIENLNENIQDMQAQVEQEFFSLRSKYQSQVDSLMRQKTEDQALINKLEKENEVTRTKTNRLLKEFEEQVAGTIANMDEKQKKAYLKLTSVARGYIGRMRAQAQRNTIVANTTGELTAIRTTTQGSSGWYAGPNGNLYYFVLREGEWTHAAGPLTAQEFTSALTSSKQRQKHLMGGILSKCAFGMLSTGDELLDKGELYIANKTDKLYLCIDMDVLMSVPLPGTAGGGSMFSSISRGSSSVKVVDQWAEEQQRQTDESYEKTLSAKQQQQQEKKEEKEEEEDRLVVAVQKK